MCSKTCCRKVLAVVVAGCWVKRRHNTIDTGFKSPPTPFSGGTGDEEDAAAVAAEEEQALK